MWKPLRHQEKVMMLILFLLLLEPFSSFAAVSPSSLAKPGCEGKCGSIDIPYPFGIGRNGSNNSCYYDEWLEIDCRVSNSSSSSPVPFLKKLNLEVLDIFLPDLIRIKSSIFSSNCNSSRSSNTNSSIGHMNLKESPFFFSTKNTFTAAGCKNRALIENIRETVVAGCTSSCNGACCQTIVPFGLKIFNVTFQSIDQEEHCRYAFLVENDLFLANSQTRCFSMVQDMDHVPALLDVCIDFMELTDEGNRLREQSNQQNSSFTCSFNLGETGLRCSCKEGFEGNAYLPNGCQDINECEDPKKNWCWEDSRTCINTYGGFRCDGGKRRVKIIIIVLGSSLALLILIIAACWLYKVFKRKQKIKLKKKFFKRNGGLLLEQQISSSQGNVETTKVFTSKELEKATDNFNANRILGQGGQGTVYKGMLSNGRIVAVKKSKVEDKGLEQFINEVVILSQINHRNVVKLLGCCLETEVPLLVYEFVPNGTLFQYLHGQIEEFPVSWEMRLQIATEVAEALSYLHSAASIPIYHRDIKSANILLDDKYRAKVADFGTSRSISIDQTHLTTLVHGTFGYLDPEYFQSSQITDKSDVYSFGVVLAELLTGQMPISSLGSEEGRSLATYFLISMKEKLLFDILDPQVKQQGREGDVVAVANLAKRCLNLNGRKRPTMREVFTELERIRTAHVAVSIGDANYEEIECVRSREYGPWDDPSASAGSPMDNQTTSSLDAYPLLPSESW